MYCNVLHFLIKTNLHIFAIEQLYNMKETISLRLDQELLAFLRKEADTDFRSVNNLVEMVLKKYKIEKEQEENKKPGE